MYLSELFVGTLLNLNIVVMTTCVFESTIVNGCRFTSLHVVYCKRVTFRYFGCISMLV